MQGRIDVDEVYEHLRVALDVRRLGEEIASFWNLPADIAIHYSKSSILQVPYALLKARTTPYLDALRLTDNAASRLDTPVTFFSERQLVSGRAKNFRIVLLPAVKHMPTATFDAIDTYLQDGGTVVMLPESCVADEYRRGLDYLCRWGIRVRSVAVPQILGLGPAEQGYDQSLSSTVDFGAGRQMTSDVLAGDFYPGTQASTIQTQGLLQELDVPGADVLAASEGHALLLHKSIGDGHLYIFAWTPTHETLRDFVDILMDRTGVERSARVTGPNGERLMQLECRVAHTKFHDLIYVVNEADEDVAFLIQTDRPFYRIRELRSLQYWDQPPGIIPGRQTFLFKFMEDPVDIGRREAEPAFCRYATHG